MPGRPRLPQSESGRSSRRWPAATVRRFNAGKTKGATTAPTTDRLSRRIAASALHPDSAGL